MGPTDSQGQLLPTTMVGMAAMVRGQHVAGADGADVDLLMRLPKRQLVDEILRLRAVVGMLQEDVREATAAQTQARRSQDAKRSAEDKRLILAQLKEAQGQGQKLPVGHTNFIRLMEAGKDPDLEASAGLECAICTDDSLTLDSAFVVGPCACIFCFGCLREHVQTQVRSHALQALVCPGEDCSSRLTYNDVANLLDGHEYEADMRKYEQFAVEDYLAADPRAVRCPKRECQAVMIKETDEPRAVCVACKHSWCTKCPGQPDWHPDSTCEKYQQWLKDNGKGDDLFAAMLKDKKNRTKPCPRCKAQIHKPLRKDGGACNHISCPCGFEWCWLCLKGPYRPGHYNEAGPCFGKQYYDEPETT